MTPSSQNARDRSALGCRNSRSEYVYLLDQLHIEPFLGPLEVNSGFNLDGLYTQTGNPAGCEPGDHLSLVDDDQNCPSTINDVCTVAPGCTPSDTGCMGGVDNQMSRLADAYDNATGLDARTVLRTRVTTNRLAILVRVAGVDDLVRDPSVTVQLFRAYPTFTTGCASIVAGREYSIAAGSLRPGVADFRTGALFSRAAQIVGGRVMVPLDPAAPSEFLFPLAFSPGGTFDLPLHSAMMRFDLSPTSIGAGSLGGYLDGRDVLAIGPMLVQHMRGGFESEVPLLVDIQLAGYCGNILPDGGLPGLGGISVAYGIHGIPATISPTVPIASAPAPGTCGS